MTVARIDAALPVGSALRSLAYLDAHIFLNRLRVIRRDPKRLASWAIFIVLLLVFLPQRFLLQSPTTTTVWSGAPVFDAVARFIPAAVLLLLGLVVLTTSRPMALFRSAADARFLAGSALPPRVVILWLSFRMLRLVLFQLPVIAIWFVIFATSIRGAVAGIIQIWSSFGLFLFLFLGLNLPLVKWRPRRNDWLRVAGITLVGLGVASLVAAIGVTSGRPVPATDFLLGLPPGSWIVGGSRGNLLAIAALAACGVAAMAISVRVAGDVYPEIWESSLRLITVRRLARGRGGMLSAGEARQALREAGVALPQPQGAVASVRGQRVPAGAWTLLWKEWLATVRVRGGLRLPVITLAVAVVIGSAAGGGFGHLPNAVAAGVITLSLYLVLIVNVFMAFRLGVDLRNPLWWLSSASLRARLLVLTLARSLRQILPIVAGLLAASIAARSVSVLIIGGPAFAAAVWVLQAMGMATYTIIPSPADMRGPGQMLRLLAVLVLILPLSIAFGIGAVVLHSLAAGLLVTAAGAAVEGWGLIAFAAFRLEGNGLAFAQAERR